MLKILGNMIDIQSFLNESLLDDFDDIVDKIDDNPFSLILNSKSEEEFMEAIDDLCRLCDKIDIADANQKKYKNSFFLSSTH